VQCRGGRHDGCCTWGILQAHPHVQELLQGLLLELLLLLCKKLVPPVDGQAAYTAATTAPAATPLLPTANYDQPYTH